MIAVLKLSWMFLWRLSLAQFFFFGSLTPKSLLIIAVLAALVMRVGFGKGLGMWPLWQVIIRRDDPVVHYRYSGRIRTKTVGGVKIFRSRFVDGTAGLKPNQLDRALPAKNGAVHGQPQTVTAKRFMNAMNVTQYRHTQSLSSALDTYFNISTTGGNEQVPVSVQTADALYLVWPVQHTGGRSRIASPRGTENALGASAVLAELAHTSFSTELPDLEIRSRVVVLPSKLAAPDLSAVTLNGGVPAIGLEAMLAELCLQRPAKGEALAAVAVLAPETLDPDMPVRRQQ